MKPVFRGVKRKLDYAEYGGMPLLGVNGVVIISHGKSSSRAIKNAMLAAERFVTGGVNDKIRQRIREVMSMMPDSGPRSARFAGLGYYLPEADADEFRFRKDGRYVGRVDRHENGHSGAAHRESGGSLRATSRSTPRARRWPTRASTRRTSTSSSWAPRPRITPFPRRRPLFRTRSARRTRPRSTWRPPAPGSYTR